MRTVSLKLKMYLGNVNVIDNRNLPKRIFQLMVMSTGALAICYVIILGSMVFNIVERKGLERQAVALSNEVGDMELVYLALSNKIDLELSHSLGFSEVKPKFATRKSLGLNSVTSNKSGNEI